MENGGSANPVVTILRRFQVGKNGLRDMQNASVSGGEDGLAQRVEAEGVSACAITLRLCREQKRFAFASRNQPLVRAHAW